MKIIILLLFVNFFVLAQTNKDSNVEKKPVENIKTNSSDTINEKNVYKFLYEETKQANDRMVSTVYWSLGGVLALALFLMGYNAFYNFKINKDQIGNINKEFENKIEKVRNEDASNLNIKFEENKKEYVEKLNQNYEYINSELGAKLLSLTETYEKQTNAYKESNELQVKTLEKSIDERTNNINNRIDVLNDQKNSEITSINKKFDLLESKLIEQIDDKISILDFRTSVAEGRLWEIAGVPINSLRSYIRTLEVEINWHGDVTYAPSKILETLNKLSSIDKSSKEMLLQVLNSSERIDRTDKENIVQKVNSLTVR